MPHRRNNFSKKTMREAFTRSGGICECHLIPHVFLNPCGRTLSDGNTFYEHIEPDQISQDNSLANCAVLVRNCWRFKTDFYDAPTIAKVRHRSDASRGIKERFRRRLPGNREAPFKILIGGGVVDRQTGLPWRGGQ
jgi:hypothetical protein